MATSYTIYVDGKAYSTIFTNFRKPERVIAAWKERTTELGYAIPSGDIAVGRTYDGALNSYGVKRGG